MMLLFKTSTGFVISFGFDVATGKPMPNRIAWCDPQTESWVPSAANMAGYQDFPFPIAPQFVREFGYGIVIAYQPGMCIEIMPSGSPTVHNFNILRAST